MTRHQAPQPAKFGAVLGVGPGGVPVRSSDYASADPAELPTRQSYRSEIDGVYMGHKWQCVELARRWLYLNHGHVFEDIAMAYDIFRLTSVTRAADGAVLPLHAFRNGGQRPPTPGALIIWREGGEFEVTGHVAVATEVLDDCVRCIEQNVEDTVWPEGQTWSRALPLTRTADGGYRLDCTYSDAEIIGWVIQTDDDAHAESDLDDDPALFRIERYRLPQQADAQPRPWLDETDPMQADYVRLMAGQNLSDNPDDLYAYYGVSETALREIRRATNELHRMFLHATNHVLEEDALLARFNLPPALHGRIRQSWNNRRNAMITGRIDFAVGPDGVKAYEYNADSASCHMEAAFLMPRWAAVFDCTDGADPGTEIEAALIKAWRDSKVDGLLHIMQDRDLEESYHARFMQRAMTAAGVETKIIHGVAGLKWGEGGQVLDADGAPIRWVWKTWAWETALDQIRDSLAEDEENLRLHRTIDRATQPPRLVDVLLREDVMVFEPLWTLITSNKAILPIVKSMYPSSRFLLDAAYEPTEALKRAGYAAKPIVGRCGANVALYDRHDGVLAETEGGFQDRDTIYQELHPLPLVEGRRIQAHAFTIGGAYAGAVVRASASMIITSSSDLLPLRVLPDVRFVTGDADRRLDDRA